MCRIMFETSQELSIAQEKFHSDLAMAIHKSTGEDLEELLNKFKKIRNTETKRIENDRPFVYGVAGTFESSNRHIENNVKSKYLLEWLKQDIAKLVKTVNSPAILTEGTGYVLIIKNLRECSTLNTLKCIKQSDEYICAKRTDTDELHCLEGSIRLMLRDAPKMSRNQIEVLQLTYIAVVHLLAKKVKSKKEQLIYAIINDMFNTCKELTGNTRGTTSEPTWTYMLKHFVARTLIDPELIRELIRMHTLNNNRKLKTGLGVMLDVIASIVSTKDNKNEVYEYLLNTTMKIIEIKE